MAFKKKNWKNRIAEYINRRTLTKTDGSSEVVYVERNEGTISQEGDGFNEANMNDLEERVAEAFGELDERLGNYIFAPTCTQAQYDAMPSHPDGTIYFIT